MAIDTQTKRRAASSYPFLVFVFPVADGTIGSFDRAHVAGFYSTSAAVGSLGAIHVIAQQVYVAGQAAGMGSIYGSDNAQVYVPGETVGQT